MATTSWKALPNVYPNISIRIYYSSMTRTNNTVTINGVKTQMKITTSGGYDGYAWKATVWVDHDGGGGNNIFVDRQVKDTTTATYDVVFESSSSNKSFSVAKDDTSGYLDATGYSNYGGWTGGGVSAWDLNIPDAGQPSIDSDSVDQIELKSARVVWTSSNGTNCTFDDMKLEWGLTTSYGSQQTGLSADGNYTITGLKPGKTYYYRLTITNGAGWTDVETGSFETKKAPGFLPLLMGV